MSRFAVIAGICGLAAGLSLAPVASASAASAPTITGPTRAPYYATVTLVGTTSTAGEHVLIYFRGAGQKAYRALRDLHSNASSRFSTTYRASTAVEYYARAGGVDSARHVTTIVSESCTVSGPAFRTLPLRSGFADPDFPDFAAFTAYRDGLWAGVGVESSTGRFGVITWRAGQRPHILARYRYDSGVNFQTEAHGSVSVVGVGPGGSVVAAVRSVHSNAPVATVPTAGFMWRDGHQVRLRTYPTWVSQVPQAVTADGSVIGAIRIGGAHPQSRVIRWSSDGSRATTLAIGSSPVADGAGDVAYATSRGWRIRFTDGRTAALPGVTAHDHGVDPLVSGPGHFFYGWSDTAQLRWYAGPDDRIGATAIAPRGFTDQIMAVGPRNDFVNGAKSSSPMHLRTPDGSYVAITHQLGLNDRSETPGLTFDSSGRLAYTATDGRVHFLTCH